MAAGAPASAPPLAEGLAACYAWERKAWRLGDASTKVQRQGAQQHALISMQGFFTLPGHHLPP